jgi:hypothetical protein
MGSGIKKGQIVKWSISQMVKDVEIVEVIEDVEVGQDCCGMKLAGGGDYSIYRFIVKVVKVVMT